MAKIVSALQSFREARPPTIERAQAKSPHWADEDTDQDAGELLARYYECLLPEPRRGGE
jgi:hypothetical protein